jgi:hypothetical protein
VARGEPPDSQQGDAEQGVVPHNVAEPEQVSVAAGHQEQNAHPAQVERREGHAPAQGPLLLHVEARSEQHRENGDELGVDQDHQPAAQPGLDLPFRGQPLVAGK